MKIQCSCGRALTVPDEAAGRRGLCPSCKKILTVPTPADSAKGAQVIATPAPSQAAGQICAICQTSLEAGDAVKFCSECRLPFHAECWDENGGCATYGCPAAPRTVKPAEPGADEVSRRGWGDTKKCPYCGEAIRAAALKCKYCHEIFSSADPMTPADVQDRQDEKTQHKQERSRATVYFIASMLACAAPVTAIMGAIWIFKDRGKFRATDSSARVMILCGFGVSCLVSALMILGVIVASFG